MKRIPTYLRNILLSVTLLLTCVSAKANHVVGVDLQYTWISGNDYKITVVIYGDCGSYDGPSSAFAHLPTSSPQVCIYDGGTYITSIDLAIQAPSAGVEVTPVCAADVSLTQCTNASFAIPGIKKFVYSAVYTVPYTSSVWRFLFLGQLGSSIVAGRALSITNISSSPVSSTQLVDTLDNTTGHNSSPVLSVIPTPFFCANNPDSYSPGAIDADGDDLNFALVDGLNGSSSSFPCTPTGTVTYLGGATGALPLTASSFGFDPTNGQITFFTSVLQRSLVVYNIEERRAGLLVGTCQREMTFLIQTCTNTPASGAISGASSGTVIDSTHFQICQNSGVFSFNINPTEAVTTNSITVTYSGLPAGATFTTTGNGTPTPHCTFSWNSTGVIPGTYTFYVTYTDNNCPLASVQTIAYSVIILPSATISWSLISAASCTKKAAISIIPGGGGISWTIDLSNAGGDTISVWGPYHGGAFTDSLVPGTYTLTIYPNPSHTCKAYVTFTVASPSVPNPTATITNPSYCGASDGTITLHHLPAGTTDTIKYFYNGVAQPTLVRVVAADSTVLITGLAAGNYTGITYKNGNCLSTATSATLVNPPFTMRALSSVNPTWCGYCDGSITLYGLRPGQTDTINYIYGGGAATPVVRTIGADSTVTLTGLCQGVYSNFIAKTAGTCVSNALGPVNLTAPPFTMRALTPVNPSYCGMCDGRITFYGLHPGQLDTITYIHDGGAGTPYAQLVGADSTITMTGLCAGVYVNFVAHTAGVCASNTLGPVILTAPPFTMRALSSTNPDYCGICNGTITLYGLHPGQTDTVTYTLGGVPQPQVIHLVGADSTIVITGLCAGTYANFIAHTAGTCISNTLGPVTLTVPPFTIRSLTSVNPSYCGMCDGTITLHGVHPGENDTITYTRDGVAQPPFIHFIASDSLVTITGLCAGAYDNFVAHTGGVCISNSLGPVSLTVPPFVVRTFSSTNPDYCGVCNGTVTIYGVHPGELDTVNYTLDGGAQPPIIQFVGADSLIHINGLCAGVYDNFIVNTGGVCFSGPLGPANLTVPPFTMRALSFTNPDYCGICNGTITLYGLHPGELDTVTYTKDGVAQPPIIQLIPLDSTIHLTGLCAGLYDNFIARTGGVCVSNTLGPANLTVPPFTMRALSFTNPDFCGICNGTITLYGLHPGQTDTISYTYNGGAQTPIVVVIPADSTVHLTGLCFGLYDNFIARTGGVCVSNTLGPANLVVPPFTMRKAVYTNPTKCGFCDGTIRLYGLHPGQTDTITYSFNGAPQSGGAYLIPADSTVLLTNLCEGIYSNIIAKTGGVCVSNALGPDTLVAPPIIDSFSYVVHEGCDGDTVVFTNYSWPASDLTYTWYFGDGGTSTATNPTHIYYTPGTFTVKLLITNTRCFDSSKQDVVLNNLIVAGFTAVPDSFLCQGNPVVFTNTSLGTSLNYAWYFGDGVTAATTDANHIFYRAGTYDIMLVVTNYVPCHDTVIMPITVDSLSAISIKATDTVMCGGHDITFTGDYTSMGNTGVIWTFSDGGTIHNQNPVVHGYSSTGIFTVSIAASYRACPDTGTTKVVTIFGYPSVNLGPDTTICAGSTGITIMDNINANNPLARFLWSDGTTKPYMSVVEPGVYYVKVNVGGCVSTDTISVDNGCFLDIPNAFTPNGDGSNDYFLPRPLLAKGLTSFSMNIYNRWGELIFQTTNVEGRGWDGRFNNVMQPEGVYIFVIDATFLDGEKEHHKGNLTLLK